jgi:hypothetical protein
MLVPVRATGGEHQHCSSTCSSYASRKQRSSSGKQHLQQHLKREAALAAALQVEAAPAAPAALTHGCSSTYTWMQEQFDQGCGSTSRCSSILQQSSPSGKAIALQHKRHLLVMPASTLGLNDLNMQFDCICLLIASDGDNTALYSMVQQLAA